VARLVSARWPVSYAELVELLGETQAQRFGIPLQAEMARHIRD